MSLITHLNKCAKGLLHDFRPLADYRKIKYEICRNCGTKVSWNKDNKGRVDNKKYLEAHRRDFLQRTGPTAKLFWAVYNPKEFDKHKDEWTIKITL